MTERYIAVYSEWNGNERTGFYTTWYWDGLVFDRREDAITRGYGYGRADDFNVGVLDPRSGWLVAIDWMEERVDDDPGVLAEVNDDLGLPRKAT